MSPTSYDPDGCIYITKSYVILKSIVKMEQKISIPVVENKL